MKKLAVKILVLIFIFIYLLPIIAYAADKIPQPAKPYDKIVAKKGSWFVEQVSNDKGSSLIVGFTGQYKSSPDKPDLTFSLNEKTIIKGICIPYAKVGLDSISIRFEDTAGKIHGEVATQAFPVEDKKIGSKDKTAETFTNQIFSSEDGVILPEGQYIMTLSNYDGVIGDFIVKGVGYAVFEKYLKDLVRWEEQNEEESSYDFTGTYSINLEAYKTSTLAGKVSSNNSDFSLKDFELTILYKKDRIELIGEYEGIPFSQEAKIVKRSKTGISAEAKFLADIVKAKLSANALVTLTKNDLNAKIDIKGSAVYQRNAGGGKGSDYNTYDIISTGHMKNKELPLFVVAALGKQGNVGNIPGPDNAAQASVGLLFPPLVGVVASALQELFKPRLRDKAWYMKKNPGLTEEQIAMLMLADAMGSTDNPDEGDIISIGDNEKPGGADYNPYESGAAEDYGETEDYEDGEQYGRDQDYPEDRSFDSSDVSQHSDSPAGEVTPAGDAYVGTGPDGEKITSYPDGTIEITTSEGDKITRSPDGSIKVKQADENAKDYSGGGSEKSKQDTGALASDTSEEFKKNAKTREAGGDLDEADDLLRLADIVDKIYGLSGAKEKCEALAKGMKDGLAGATDDLRKAFAAGGSDDAIKSFLKMNKLANITDELSHAANGVSTGFELAGMGLDTLNNMQDLNRADGSLISGDGFLKALGKSVLVNKLASAIGEKNPAIVAMDIANAMALGGTEAGDIISPLNNIKGAMNALIDGVIDPEQAVDRALAGGYGQNIKNLTDGALLAKDALKEPGKFIDELGEIGNDKKFFEGMYDSAGSMFRDEKGNIGYVGSVGEATAQMGVAMAETAASMAKMAGTISGHVYENVSSRISSFFNW